MGKSLRSVVQCTADYPPSATGQLELHQEFIDNLTEEFKKNLHAMYAGRSGRLR